MSQYSNFKAWSGGSGGGVGAIEIRSAGFDRGGRRVLDVPALSIPERAIALVRGANGAGKSTLLRGIVGLEQPVTGTIRVGGHAAGSTAARRCIAYAPQSPVFFRGSVRYNLELPASLRKDTRGGMSVETAAELLGIAHLLDRAATALSGGEAQRTNVARAILARAPVTLLDEPLAGMDEALRGDLFRKIVELHRAEGRTLVASSHEPAGEDLADLVVKLPMRD